MSVVLVTGGTGFVGAHVCAVLDNAGFDFVILDNLSNSKKECVEQLEAITKKPVKFEKCDLTNAADLDAVFKKYQFKHVIHLAAFKAVGKSKGKPLEYFQNNLTGTLNLFEAMRRHGVFNLVFSSSSTVYGMPQYLPVDELHPIGGCTNPYGKTKFFIEEMFKDLTAADKRWNIVSLRYFNPVGAHSSGLIGEEPPGIPPNLMPFVSRVAVGKFEKLKVFGSDYPTRDGTCIRDYTHVVDIAEGHVLALRKAEKNCGLKVYNLGGGRGFSVLEMVAAMENVVGKKIPYEFTDRRAGDTPACYATCKLAKDELGWKNDRGLEEMCKDLWRWQSMNPDGYSTDFSGLEILLDITSKPKTQIESFYRYLQDLLKP